MAASHLLQTPRTTTRVGVRLRANTTVSSSADERTRSYSCRHALECNHEPLRSVLVAETPPMRVKERVRVCVCVRVCGHWEKNRIPTI